MITKEEAKKNQAAIVKRLLARKNKRMTPEQVIEQGKKLHAKRKYWGEVDAAKSGKKRLAPTYNNLMRWVQHPGTYDLIGVDVSADAEPTLVARQVKKSKVMGLFGL